jgi:hypothetical protein
VQEGVGFRPLLHESHAHACFVGWFSPAQGFQKLQRGRPFSPETWRPVELGSAQFESLKPLFEWDIPSRITTVSAHQMAEPPSKPVLEAKGSSPEPYCLQISYLDRDRVWISVRAVGLGQNGQDHSPKSDPNAGLPGGEVSGGSHCRPATAGASRSAGPERIPAASGRPRLKPPLAWRALAKRTHEFSRRAESRKGCGLSGCDQCGSQEGKEFGAAAHQ